MPRRDNGSQARSAAGIGIVGGGQLARMMCEAASPLALHTAVLAARHDDAAIPVAGDGLVGSPNRREDLERLAERCGVLTFDHEQIDLAALHDLEQSGHLLHPGTGTLAFTVDKALMRRRLHGAGIPVPHFEKLPEPRGDTAEQRGRVDGFARTHSWPLILKAASGGYDGKGVWVVECSDQAAEVLTATQQAGTRLLVEEQVRIAAELAVLVARRPDGQSVVWPVAETAQVDGVCREVLVPGRLPTEVMARAQALAVDIANLTAAVGVLAVELFWTGEQLVVNELAARPHNSGHWTIEGSQTSQFENHLRAVLDLPLGETELLAPRVASVNIFGNAGGGDPSRHLAEALGVRGAHVHLYSKVPRGGRKLGHVTVRGDDPAWVRGQAWQAARALSAPVPHRREVTA